MSDQKKFSELKTGDVLWLWCYNELRELPVKDVSAIPRYMINSDGMQQRMLDDDICITLQDGTAYNVYHGFDSNAMIWGSDGWHEYVIFGTSKDAVKELLENTLKNDISTLDASMKTWLERFGD